MNTSSCIFFHKTVAVSAFLLFILTVGAESAELSRIQRGGATISNGTNATTVPIEAVNPNQSFLTYSSTISEIAPTDYQIAAALTNSTTLTFERNGTAGDVAIRWQVFEFAAGATVQHGTLEPSVAANDTTIPIAAVDRRRSFVLVNARNFGNTFNENETYVAELTSATTLRFTMYGPPDQMRYYYQVVEFEDAAVTIASPSLSETETAVSHPLSGSVDPDRTFLVTTAKCSTAVYPEQMPRVSLTDSQTVTLIRESGGPKWDTYIYIIELWQGAQVTRGETVFLANQVTNRVGTTLIDTSRTGIFCPGLFGRYGSSPYPFNDNMGYNTFTFDISHEDSLYMTRAVGSGYPAVVNWELVNFDNENYALWPYDTALYINTTSEGAATNNTVTDFPLLITLTGDNFDFSQWAYPDNGADLRFSSAEGEQLNYHIEYWHNGAGTEDTASVWVQVPTIEGNRSDQYITMHWGMSDVSSRSDPELVFNTDDSFQAVYHLNEEGNSTAGGYADASGNGFDATGTNLLSDADVAGIAGAGQYSEGLETPAQSIILPLDATAGLSDFTVSLWINTTENGSDTPCILGFESGTGNDFRVGTNDGNLYYEADLGGTGNEIWQSASAVNDNQWHHLALVHEANTAVRLYLDGEHISAGNDVSSDGSVLANQALRIMAQNGPSVTIDRPHEGIYDEIRIETTARSTDWIKLSYETQRKDSRTLSTVSPEAFLPLTVRAAATACSLWTDRWTLIFDQSGTGRAQGGIYWLSDSSAAQATTIPANQVTDNLFSLSYINGTDTASTAQTPHTFSLLSSTHFTARLREEAILEAGAIDSLLAQIEYTVHGSGKLFLQVSLYNRSTTDISGDELFFAASRRETGTSAFFRNNDSPDSCTWLMLTDDSRGAFDLLLTAFEPWNSSSGYPTPATVTASEYDADLDSRRIVFRNTDFTLASGQKQTFHFMLDFAHKGWSDSTGIAPIARSFERPDTVISFITGSVDLSQSWERNLRGEWRLDEGAGSFITDFSRNNNNGTLNSGTWVSGPYGGTDYALDLLSGERISVPHNNSLNTPYNMTLCAWLRPTAPLSQNDTIAAKHDNSAGYQLTGSTGGGLAFRSDNQIIESQNPLPVNTWTHVAASYLEEADAVKIYINGKVDKIETGTITGNSPNISDLGIGGGYAGIIDDIRFYGEGLEEEEIMVIRNNGFNAARGRYQVRADNNNAVHFYLHGSESPKYFPLVHIANYWSDNSDPLVYVDGVVQTRGTSSSEGDYYIDLKDDFNVLTVGFNKIFTTQTRIYIDDNDPGGSSRITQMPKMIWGTGNDGQDHVWVKNFDGTTFGQKESNEFFIDWASESMNGELWYMATSETNTGQVIDTSNQINNQIDHANAPDANTTAFGGLDISLGAIGDVEQTQSWTSSSTPLYTVAESSDVRVVLRVENRTVSSATKSTQVMTEWTFYPTGQIFRYDSIYGSTDPFIQFQTRFGLRYFTDSTVYVNNTAPLPRGGLHSTSGLKDFAVAFLGFRDQAGTTGNPYSQGLTDISQDNGAGTGDISLGFSTIFNPTPNYFEVSDQPVQSAFYIDLSSENMTNGYIDSVANGVQSIRFTTFDVLQGSPVFTSTGDLNNDGFNEREGAYIVRADNNALTARIYAINDTCRFYPAFRITNYTSLVPPRYVFLFDAADTVTLQADYDYNIYHNESENELIIQLDTVLCEESWLYLSPDQTLAVTMSGFNAISGVSSDTLVWTTESEQENMGFNLYRRIKPAFIDSIMNELASCPQCDNLSPLARAFKSRGIDRSDTLWKAPLNRDLIPGAGEGVSFAKRTYRYIDHAVTHDVCYQYRLEAIDNEGNHTWFGPVEATPFRYIPRDFMLGRNYPNPFRRFTTIAFALPRKSKVSLTIFSLQGRKIRTLITPTRDWSAARHHVTWDGLDDQGTPTAAGPFIYRFSVAEEFVKSKMMIRIP